MGRSVQAQDFALLSAAKSAESASHPAASEQCVQGEGCEVVGAVEIELRAGLRDGLGLSRGFRQ